MSQLDENGKELPIFYASKSLNEAEKNYSTYEKEEIAIVFALKNVRHYLLCHNFKLLTNHEALKYVISNRDQMEESLDGLAYSMNMTLKL